MNVRCNRNPSALFFAVIFHEFVGSPKLSIELGQFQTECPAKIILLRLIDEREVLQRGGMVLARRCFERRVCRSHGRKFVALMSAIMKLLAERKERSLLDLQLVLHVVKVLSLYFDSISLGDGGEYPRTNGWILRPKESFIEHQWRRRPQ